MLKQPVTEYRKHHSFKNFFSRHEVKIEAQRGRAIRLLDEALKNGTIESARALVLQSAKEDLAAAEASPEAAPAFKITQFIADEMHLLEDRDLPRYVFHRYRYDVHPAQQKLDEYPPYLQIEPSSICNFRCVFCYQTDKSFSTKSSGHMGTMSLDLFKRVVDQAATNVEFISLASRGEPLVCKQLPEMLAYSRGKFLSLKVNTNASLLTENLAHAILSGGVQTVVFSADAAEEPLYSQLRVNGSLKRTLQNIEMFQEIRAKHYADAKVITRVSGVKVNEQQDMDSMAKVWGSLVDQLAFVSYNPWENVYDAAVNTISAPCTDLWRRMFVWFDGRVNPCDTDYRTTLLLGNIQDKSLSEIWHSPRYGALRASHSSAKRSAVSPCNRCQVI